MGKVVHASYSGYFPFCIKERTTESIGSGTPYPIGLSLENLMRFFWIINEFSIGIPSKNYVTPVNFKNGEISSWNYDLEQQIVFRNGFENEEDHVCYPRNCLTEACGGFPKDNTTTISSIDFTTFNGRLYFLDFSFVIGRNDSTQYNVIKDNDLYYPWLNISFNVLDVDLVPSPPPQYNSINSTQKNLLNVLSPEKCNFFNLGEIDLYADLTLGSLQFYDSFELLAQSYWSYGGTYDTSTGLPL